MEGDTPAVSEITTSKGVRSARTPGHPLCLGVLPMFVVFQMSINCLVDQVATAT